MKTYAHLFLLVILSCFVAGCDSSPEQAEQTITPPVVGKEALDAIDYPAVISQMEIVNNTGKQITVFNGSFYSNPSRLYELEEPVYTGDESKTDAFECGVGFIGERLLGQQDYVDPGELPLPSAQKYKEEYQQFLPAMSADFMRILIDGEDYYLGRMAAVG